jgi:Flp pilus assembly protein CpaB
MVWDTSVIEVTRDQARLIAAQWGASILSLAERPGDETREKAAD